MSQDKSSETTPSIEYIDGPMLPHLLQGSTDTTIPQTTTSLVPIITPPLATQTAASEEVADAQQYLLVPNSQRIIVRSAHHGKRVCTLVPKGDESIHAVTLVWLPVRGEEADTADDENDEEEDSGEWVVVAGCSNGTLQEWSITKVSAKSNEEVAPRRVFQLTCSKTEDVNMVHLTSFTVSDAALASSLYEEKGGAPLYGLIHGTGKKSEKNSSCVVSCLIPRFDDNGDDQTEGSIDLKRLVPTKNLKSSTSREEKARLQKSHVCLKKGDSIFGLKAAYRPSSSTALADTMDYEVEEEDSNGISQGDLFLVICASKGFVIYRESIKSSSSKQEDGGEMVHFELPMKSSYQSKEQSAFSSIAISPDAKNLALGRLSGHMEILDDVFDNVAKFLNAQSNGQDVDQQQHPEAVTVRKSVHWHANPVRALAFLADSGRHKGNSGSLISGGEESVLVTWQLDRDFHRPSHFVSRVGQGGILHTLCCMHTGKIVVFCSDNSVQCFHGANYDRLWTEQGIASMMLHEEGVIKGIEKQNDIKKGPVLMSKDPITGHPILANLPGAPGMVHWYDPKSASVVGTLEVSPYNRVSRRDPRVDPNIPTPAVTHIAIGQDGKDMITVDTVWTENTSVGREYTLVGPQGDETPMSVCTSIKFYSFSDAKGRKPDQRKHRHGDLPMSYELVSSMASPHGREGEVCALAISPNGETACTLSRQEDAFRIWSKNTTYSPSGVPSVMWKCLYKVKTPAGFANLLSQNNYSSPGQNLVAFSSDGSVLSVCYGTHVTLWDHASATLLNSLSSAEGIQHLHFLTKDDDFLLMTSESQVAIKSPFGGAGQSCYLGNDEWSVDLSAFGRDAKVSSVIPFGDSGLGARGFFAVSVAIDNGAETVVMVVDRSERGVASVKDSDSLMYWRIKGGVSSLCANECIGSGVELLAITEDCRMLSLNVGIHKAKTLSLKSQSTSISRTQAPVLQVGSEVDSQPMKKRKISTMPRGTGKAQQFETGFEFPSLSGKFITSFLSKRHG
mmetsp:Transcript_8600/g.14620  ORF Transcript_8600/g.14620 Transcript_8600/m.14620 type:complete len:1015 (+) Transcript_8600:109-3153(+)